MRFAAFFLTLLIAATGWAQNYPSPTLNNLTVKGTISGTAIGTGAGQIPPSTHAAGNTFWAPAYGSCTWTLSGDVGPCINAAIAAAAAAGGGTALVPAGAYGLATTVTNSTSGVQVAGAGTGNVRDGVQPGAFQAITRLVWNGAAGATMFDLEPVAGASSETLYAAGVQGVVFDCNTLASICAKIAQVSYSTFDIGTAEARSIGQWWTTTTTIDGGGNQHNIILRAYSRQTSASLAYKATGILFDAGVGSNYNFSFNNIIDLQAWYNNGDGIVFGNSDNNIIYNVYTNEDGSGGNGSPFVLAGYGYTMPNGQTVTGNATSTHILHADTPIRETGYASGTTITNGTHTGTAVPGSISFTVSAAAGNQFTASSATGLVAGETVNCGSGTASGLMPNATIKSVSGTTVVLNSVFVAPVANGTSCVATFGANASAAVGTYTLTATSSTTFNLTAPSGGTSQTGVTISNGVLVFTDLVIPLTGTAAAGDTYSIVTPYPAGYNSVKFIDSSNSLPPPTFEPGAQGDYATSAAPYPTVVGPNGVYINTGLGNGSATGLGSFATGSGNASGYACNAFSIATCSAPYAFAGGVGTVASGYGAFIMGHNSTANVGYGGGIGEYLTLSGAELWCVGENASCSGNYTVAGGNCYTDRGDTAMVYASGCFAAQGDQQKRETLLSVALSSTTATALTVGGGAASGANSLRIPVGTMAGVVVEGVVCRDTTNTANWARWRRKEGQIVRGTGTPAYTGDDSTATAPDFSGGSGVGGAGATLLIGADATNNVLSLKVAWPGANLTHCTADAYLLEVQ